MQVSKYWHCSKYTSSRQAASHCALKMMLGTPNQSQWDGPNLCCQPVPSARKPPITYYDYLSSVQEGHNRQRINDNREQSPMSFSCRKVGKLRDHLAAALLLGSFAGHAFCLEQVGGPSAREGPGLGVWVKEHGLQRKNFINIWEM